MSVFRFFGYSAFAVLNLLILSANADNTVAHVTVYTGKAMDNKLHQIGWPLDWQSYPKSKLAGAAFAREIARIADDTIGFEIETTLLRHWGKQLAWDTSVAGAVRWHSVPWQDALPGSMAFSAGISRFSRISKIEQERLQNQAKTLGYLAAEVTGSASEESAWEGVARWHHRSGGYGTFNNVTGGSNYLLLGVRKHL